MSKKKSFKLGLVFWGKKIQSSYFLWNQHFRDFFFFLHKTRNIFIRWAGIESDKTIREADERANTLKCEHSKMGSRALVMAKGLKCFPSPNHRHQTFNVKPLLFLPNNNSLRRNSSTSTSTTVSSLQPPDVPRLAQTAQISLAPHEVLYLSRSTRDFRYFSIISTKCVFLFFFCFS